MPRRRSFRLLALVPLVGALAAVPAIAATSAPNKATVDTLGGTKFKINQYAQDESRFSTAAVSIKSGGTLTIADKSGQAHTISLVTKRQLPKTTKQIEACKVCEAIGKAHQIDADGNPAVNSVNVGKAGFDKNGDSEVIAPHKKVTVKVSAKKGSTLYFICAIHPWMQGKITVG